VFLERKITGRMHGNEFAGFSAIIGWKALKDSVEQYGDDKNGFTTLLPNLEGKDPDDAFSSVPYVHPFTGNLTRRKKDLISCTRSKLKSAVPKSSNPSYQLISPTSDSSPLQRTNSSHSSINGSPRNMARK